MMMAWYMEDETNKNYCSQEVTKKSKTEMAASFQGNKSKHRQNVPTMCPLFCRPYQIAFILTSCVLTRFLER